MLELLYAYVFLYLMACYRLQKLYATRLQLMTRFRIRGPISPFPTRLHEAMLNQAQGYIFLSFIDYNRRVATLLYIVNWKR
jgi:predicted component of type VI protein secretion system